ncbi:hypothetical protein DFH28DRAFT_957899 [Melampsora americana]|nr:hypothetical protein DFH28DRAFT_957899 [Melampsora americana]
MLLDIFHIYQTKLSFLFFLEVLNYSCLCFSLYWHEIIALQHSHSLIIHSLIRTIKRLSGEMRYISISVMRFLFRLHSVCYWISFAICQETKSPTNAEILQQVTIPTAPITPPNTATTAENKESTERRLYGSFSAEALMGIIIAAICGSVLIILGFILLFQKCLTRSRIDRITHTR